MQKASRSDSTPSNGIVVTVSRFGHDPINVTVSPDACTVQDVLEEAGVVLEGREELFVEGERAEGPDELENGDILSIVTSKQAG